LREGITEERGSAELLDGFGFFRGAAGVGGSDHAFEEIAFDALTGREVAEVA
jgi:hypothetical protein